MLRHRSIRFRLTFWYAAILTAGMALFGGLLWFSLRQRLLHEIDEDLSGRASRFETYFRALSAAAGPQLRDELEEFCQDCHPAPMSNCRAKVHSLFVARLGPRRPPNLIGLCGGNLRFRAALTNSKSEPRSGTYYTRSKLLQILLWTLIPVVVAIATVGGAWLSARALKPVNDITAAALTVSIENLLPNGCRCRPPATNWHGLRVF